MEMSQGLKAGVEILDSFMESLGFVYTQISAGAGSGGSFASGEFRRGDRRLELHFLYSLGLVTYRHPAEWHRSAIPRLSGALPRCKACRCPCADRRD